MIRTISHGRGNAQRTVPCAFIKNGDFAISEKRSGQKILEMHIASAKGTAYNDRNRKEKSSKIAVSVSTKTGYHWFPVTEDDDDDI